MLKPCVQAMDKLLIGGVEVSNLDTLATVSDFRGVGLSPNSTSKRFLYQLDIPLVINKLESCFYSLIPRFCGGLLIMQFK